MKSFAHGKDASNENRCALTPARMRGYKQAHIQIYAVFACVYLIVLCGCLGVWVCRWNLERRLLNVVFFFWLAWFKWVNPFLINVSIWNPLKAPENPRFSGVFRGYQIGTLTRTGLNFGERPSKKLSKLSSIHVHFKNIQIKQLSIKILFNEWPVFYTVRFKNVKILKEIYTNSWCFSRRTVLIMVLPWNQWYVGYTNTALQRPHQPWKHVFVSWELI